MKEKEKYIVMGSTGEYTDRSEWCVGIVDTEQDAQKVVAFLETQLKKIPARWFNDVSQYDIEIHKIMEGFDPRFSVDYTGTRYYYCSTVELDMNKYEE